MPAGRPSTYSEEIANTICTRMEQGESLRAICRSDGMPDMSTVLLWLTKHQEFSVQYTRAREAQADAIFDEIEDIATKAVKAGDANEIAGRRLLVDTQKWRLGRMMPKKYGDRSIQDINHSGEITTKIVNESEREIIARYQQQQQQGE